METKLSWKKGILSNKCNIYSGNTIIGKLKENVFSQQLNCDINGKNYIFRKKGIFSNETQIIDEATEVQIGIMEKNIWNSKVLIKLGDKLFNWKYNNTWQTKWSVSNSDGEKINYNGIENKGDIESQIENDLLLLSGLSVANFNMLTGSTAFYIVFIVIIFNQILF